MLLKNKLIMSIVIVFLSIGLVSCAEVGTKQRTLTFNIYPASTINPNNNQQASPLVIAIYLLKNTESFNGTDFFNLYQNPKIALGDDYISSKQFTVLPGQNRTITMTAPIEAHYVGVLAAFRYLISDQWLATQPINHKGINFNLYLNREQIQLAQ